MGRAVPKRVLATAFALLAVSMLLARGLTELVIHYMHQTDVATESTKRLHSIVAALPSVARTPHAVVFLGSSPTQLDISPGVFDERIHATHPELTSFDLGFAGVTPSLLRAVTVKVQRAFADEHQKASVVVLELNSVQATQRASDSDRLEALVLVNMLQVLEPRDWPAFFWRSPVLAGRAATYLALGGYPPAYTTRMIGSLIFGAAPSWWPGPVPPPPEPAPEDEITDKLNQTLEHIYGGPQPGWAAQYRGEPRQLFPETLDALRELDKLASADRDDVMKEDRERRIHDGDIIDLHYDPRQIDDLLAAVQAARRFSDHTFVLISPRNVDWIEHSPEGKARLRAVIERIERDGQVRVIDFDTNPVMPGGAFLDSTHLDELNGRRQYSALLADRVSELLRAEER